MPEQILSEPPCFVDVDNVFGGDEMARVYKGLISEGVIGPSALAVSERSGGAVMGIDVAAGAAWINGDDSALLQPVYHQVSNSVVQVSVDAADATNPRIDRVVLQIDDATFDATGARQARIEVLTGTPAASPAAPAEPDSAITLATISVAANDTAIEDADITDARTQARIGDGFVDTASLVDALVTTAKINDLAVTEPKLGSGAVTRGKIGNGEVHTEKIADDAVTTAKIEDITNSAISLAAGWSNTGGGTHSAFAHKDVTDRVHLRGVVTAPNPVTSTLGTVPSGFRPWAEERFPIAVDQSNTGFDSAPWAKIAVDGTITVFNVMDGVEVSLSGITYHIDV